MGELCTFSKGHGYSKADIRDAGTPLILYGRLYTQYESRIEEVDTFAVGQDGSILSRGNEVIVPASGETAEDIAVASSVRRSGIILGGDLNVVTPTSKLDPDYTALAITYSKAHDDLAKRAQGKSVVHVHGNDIAEVEVPYPSESEQKRISSVVLNLDSLITLHQRKRKYRGLYGYLSWEQRKLGDLISVYIAHAGPEEDVTVLTSSRDGIQKQEDHFGRLQQHDTSDWNLIPYGYCTYRNRSDDGLFTFNVNKVADRGIVSKFYPVFETPECDADFLVAYLNSSQEIRKKLFVLAVGTSQVVLSYGALKELSLLLPQNREQSAIANVLNHIDNLITLHQ